MNYLWHITILVSLYAILGMSLNLVVGYAGLLSLCHAAFYGLGAYATALLMLKAHWNFFPAMLTAVVLTVLFSLAVSVPATRLKGDFFVLATLATQSIVFSLLYNWVNLTQGPYGIPGIPVPAVYGFRVDTPFLYCVFACALALFCGLMLWGLSTSPFGRVLKAIREDEVAAVALGKNTTFFKICAFVIGAAFAAVPGALFAGYVRYIDPTSFTLMESIFVLSTVILGGAGTVSGPVIGAVLMVVVPETLRFLPLSDAVAANARQIIYGLVLIVLMRFRPQGIQGEYRFE